MGAGVLLLCLCGNVYTDFFERGNAAYAAGDMAGAVASYNQLVWSGVENPEVFYNLGCAYYHQADLGRAVLNFERSAGLDPGFEAAQRALAAAVSETANKSARPAYFGLRGTAGPLLGIRRHHIRAFAVVFWWLLWGILAVRQRKGRGRWSKATATAWGLVAMCAAVFLLPDSMRQAAVVVGPASPARYGPHMEDEVRMSLAPGDRVIVDRTADGWARVELADGRRGWVEENVLAYVGPPFNKISNERDIQTE